LPHVRVDSPVYQGLRTRLRSFGRHHVSAHSDHLNLRLGSPEHDIFQRMSAKHRSELRRQPKLLEKHYPGAVKICCYKTLEDVPQLCEDADELMQKSYQRSLGAGFSVNQENIERMKLLASKDWLIAYILYVASKPCALWIGVICRDTLYLEFTGYDPEFTKYEPGTILLIHIISEMGINYGHVKNVDYGFGGAPYKHRFANEHWQEVTMQVSAPTLKGNLISASKKVNATINKAAAIILERSGLLQRVKTTWRKRLISRS
jgi:hypothetical protein